MSFAFPQALWLVVLAPITVLVAGWAWRRRLRDAAAWVAGGLWERLHLRVHHARLWVSLALLFLTVLGAALALARPRWGVTEELVERQGVDIVFLLDSSLSMRAQDVPPSRMDIAKTLVRRMVGALPGHRVALVQAEGQGVVLVPLTVDAAVIDLVLDTVTAGSLPQPGTRLGSAIGEGIKLYPPESERHRVLVLISDGEDHGGGWDTIASRLAEAHIVAHTIGVGTGEGAPIPLPDEGGPQYKQDQTGQVVVSQLDEKALRGLSKQTGGLYLQVDRAAAEPAELVAAIEEMEKRTFEGEILNLQAERFQWPLAASALALALYLALSPFTRKRTEFPG
ncbi:MAG: VWA domain-containing protein [Acidobacteriota bacterium]|nr:VWA domain-containing protein [Acidobacteriota bacterium]